MGMRTMNNEGQDDETKTATTEMTGMWEDDETKAGTTATTGMWDENKDNEL